jgi:hypothetical protein
MQGNFGFDYLTTSSFTKDFSINKISVQEPNIFAFDSDLAISNDFQGFSNAILYLNCYNIQYHIINHEIVITKENHPAQYFFLSVLLFESSISICKLKGSSKIDVQFEMSYNAKIDELKEVWGNLSRSETSLIHSFCIEHSLKFFRFIQIFEGIYKTTMNLKAAGNMKQFLIEGGNFNAEILDTTSGVSIYGSGNLGRLLARVLKKRDIKVTCFIDEDNLNSVLDSIPVIKLKVLPEVQDNGPIIVTPVYDFEQIETSLRDVTTKKIISLSDLF